MAFANAVKEFIKENPDNIDPRKILGPAKLAMREAIIEKKCNCLDQQGELNSLRENCEL